MPHDRDLPTHPPRIIPAPEFSSVAKEDEEEDDDEEEEEEEG